MKIIVSAFAILILFGCAAVNPNPNVGARSVGLMVQAGNCQAAIEFLRNGADRGEPWAQARLGYFAYTKQCPGISLQEGDLWLAKAACHIPSSDWEKGKNFSFGPSGFFNARNSSFNAADVLQLAAKADGLLAVEWYWTNIAINLFEQDHNQRRALIDKQTALEYRMSDSEKKRARELDICGSIRNGNP